MDGPRIDKVLVHKIQPKETAEIKEEEEKDGMQGAQ